MRGALGLFALMLIVAAIYVTQAAKAAAEIPSRFSSHFGANT